MQQSAPSPAGEGADCLWEADLQASDSSSEKRVFGLHPNVFFLGLVSFFTDASSELIFTLLPLFLLNVLKASVPVIGLVEGVAESTATMLKLVSGWLSDRVGARKGLAVVGYGLSAVVKPMMYFVGVWGGVLGIRFADRLGKGIRSAPRDALIADSVTPLERGKAYGLHRAMDTAGALLGILLAAAVVFATQKAGLGLTLQTYRTLVLFGLVPAGMAMAMFFFVIEKKRQPAAVDLSQPGSPPKASLTGFDARFKVFIGLTIIFSLGRFSDAFIILRAQERGASVFMVLLMLATFNLVYALASVPAGILSDRLGRKSLLLIGWGLSMAVYLGFAGATSTWFVWLLFAINGLFFAATEGVARAFVADLVGPERRGTAFGIYYAAVGASVLPASLLAGLLWQVVDPAAPFVVGACLAFLAVVGLMTMIRR